MGWVSTLEDIIDRLNRDLESVNSQRDLTESDENKLKSLIRTCERIRVDLEHHLEIATNPELEIVEEWAKLEDENAELRKRVEGLVILEERCSELEKEKEKFLQDFISANARAAKNKSKVDELEAEVRGLKKEIQKRSRGR